MIPTAVPTPPSSNAPGPITSNGAGRALRGWRAGRIRNRPQHLGDRVPVPLGERILEDALDGTPERPCAVLGVVAGVDADRSDREVIAQAGADALELNIYYLPTDPNLSGSEVDN